MRKFNIPSISALSAFEAAARHESFALAAKELSLTESAISRQISTLESNLGVRLFVRNKQRVILTRAGSLYASRIREPMAALDRNTLDLIAFGDRSGHLELAVLPTFASHWLIPRLPAFNRQHPDISINMGIQTDIFHFEQTHFEAAIHFGSPTWVGTSADYLFKEEVVPICSAGLLKKPLTRAEDLLEYPLLHSTTRPNSWHHWFKSQGIDTPKSKTGVRYELHTMLISGAAAGMGIALIPKFFIEGRLDQLGIIIPFDAAGTEDAAYYLVYPTEYSHGTALTLFRTWLLDECRSSREPGK
ncbi:transcriptional regulator [Advenella faeciporci]|uniref:Transcriptional regulator n=1 Tax=Advenella faeciporci TaxID=797535 RepID=A0A918JQB3_9BURK|nr:MULTISPECIES: LysR substrate-binding domain-containing protein [Advenella]WKU19208.1 LysR substrate-binding domain-containing protein [Advenella alkanexedens]GGW93050.1 transcriptional regulator [Advenella faeciporci]